jgi:hypothetical protein
MMSLCDGDGETDDPLPFIVQRLKLPLLLFGQGRPGRLPLALQAGEVKQRQSTDSFKVREVQREQGQLIRNRSCRNEEVRQGDQPIASAEVAINIRRSTDAGGIKR